MFPVLTIYHTGGLGTMLYANSNPEDAAHLKRALKQTKDATWYQRLTII